MLDRRFECFNVKITLHNTYFYFPLLPYLDDYMFLVYFKIPTRVLGSQT